MGAAGRIRVRSIGAEIPCQVSPSPPPVFPRKRESRASEFLALDSRFRGNDEKKIVGEPQLFAPSIGLGQNEYWTRWSRSKAARTSAVGERLQ